MDEILKILPVKISKEIMLLKELVKITEIRLRVNTNLVIYNLKEEIILNVKVESEDLNTILKNVSSNSIYSIQDKLNRGYITIKGGHRLGIAGEVVLINGVVKNIKYISSINIRVAHECVGVSDEIINEIISNGEIKNTIILSMPCKGKTTLLRDIVRNISNRGFNTVVIDERGEIASMYDGMSNLTLGSRTDVISFIDKSYGMQMAVRSLSPDVICTDEIGDEKDFEAIKYVSRCGVKFVTTMHGNSLENIKLSKMNELLELGFIDNVILLGEKIGSIKKIYKNVSKVEERVC